jgi:tetraacyldisaccharide 4'-kinase
LRLRLDEPFWWYGRGPAAPIPAACLAPLGALYGRVVEARFARAKPYQARLPVICVGNLTAGGTGKTPLTLELCRRLKSAGLRPAVLTRGYGGNHAGPHWVAEGDGAAAVGDEALLLARAAPTLVARDRAAGAKTIERALQDASTEARPLGGIAADVIVMDDGLQNPQLAKDLTLAVVDGRRGLGNGRVIPAGPLRAPLAAQLRRVDAIVVNEPADGSGDVVAASIGRRFEGPILRCATAAAVGHGWLTGLRVVAWAGIGAPQRFFALLATLGADLAATVVFGDHEPLRVADARRLIGLAAQQAATLVTTEKDMARLTGASGELARLAAATRVLPIALLFPDPDSERLTALIESAVRKRSG